MDNNKSLGCTDFYKTLIYDQLMWTLAQNQIFIFYMTFVLSQNIKYYLLTSSIKKQQSICMQQR